VSGICPIRSRFRANPGILWPPEAIFGLSVKLKVNLLIITLIIINLIFSITYGGIKQQRADVGQ